MDNEKTKEVDDESPKKRQTTRTRKGLPDEMTKSPPPTVPTRKIYRVKKPPLLSTTTESGDVAVTVRDDKNAALTKERGIESSTLCLTKKTKDTLSMAPALQADRGYAEDSSTPVVSPSLTAATTPGAFAVTSDGEPREQQPPNTHSATRFEEDPTPTISHVLFAQTVDEQALTREIGERQSEQIRNRILDEAVIATNVLQEQDKQHQSFSYRNRIPLLLTLIIIVIVAAVLSVTLRRDDEGAVGDSTTQPTSEPTEAPSSFPTLSEFESLVQILSTMSSREILLDETSAQNQALRWLYAEDSFRTLDDSLELTNRYVLALLYFSTGGYTWFDRLGFLSNSSVCQWVSETEAASENSNGIRCNSQSELVLIRLDNNNLNGTLPDELSSRKSLEVISMATNSLHGTIPASVGSLVSLESLELFQNEISGPLPDSLVSLSRLEKLWLLGNNMNGTLPSFLTKMEMLRNLNLHQNNFTGTLPDFPPQSRLLNLALGLNHLVGTIPSSVYSIPNLITIGLEENDLSGTISTLIGGLTRLSSMALYTQGITGTIPTEIGALTELEYLGLQENLINGTIPSELGNLEKLQRLVLGDMRLWGTIPSTLARLSSVVTFHLDGNQLTGEVPSELGQLQQFPGMSINIGNNSLTGSVNDTFCIGPPPLGLVADCDEIECPCCTECCSDETGTCVADLNQICNVLESEYEDCDFCNSVFGTECECVDNGAIHSCTDACESCNFDGTFCTRSVDFGYDLGVTGFDSHYRCNLRYTAGREGNFSVIYDFLNFECSASLDGIPCNTCEIDVICDDAFEGLRFDCTNVQDEAYFDECDPNQDGESWLPLQELGVSDGCYTCL